MVRRWFIQMTDGKNMSKTRYSSLTWLCKNFENCKGVLSDLTAKSRKKEYCNYQCWMQQNRFKSGRYN